MILKLHGNIIVQVQSFAGTGIQTNNPSNSCLLLSALPFFQEFASFRLIHLPILVVSTLGDLTEVTKITT